MLKQEGVEFISGAVAPHKLESFWPCGGGNREGAAITTRLTALSYGQGSADIIRLNIITIVITIIITIITVTITIQVVPPSYCRGREMAPAQGTRFIEIYKPAPLLLPKVRLFKITTVN